MFVKPAEGRKVRDPHTRRFLADEGQEVPETTFWLRRLASGDVLAVQAEMIPDHRMVIEGEDNGDLI